MPIDEIVTVDKLDPETQLQVTGYACYLIVRDGDDQDFARLTTIPEGKNLAPDERRAIMQEISRKQLIDTHPVAAMLMTDIDGGRSEAMLHETLKSSVLLAAVQYPSRNQTIRVACRRVRLISAENSRWLFDELLATDGTLDSIVSRLRRIDKELHREPLPVRERKARIRRCADLRVPLGDYVDGRLPRVARPRAEQEKVWEEIVALAPDAFFEDERADQRIIQAVHHHGEDAPILTPMQTERRMDSRATPPSALKGAQAKQMSDARQAIAEIHMRAVCPPAYWGSLVANEIAATLRECFRRWEEENAFGYALIAMAIFLGRQPIELLCLPRRNERSRPATNEYWAVERDRLLLVVRMDLPDLARRSRARILIPRGRLDFSLALPKPLEAAARQIIALPETLRTPDSLVAEQTKVAMKAIHEASHARLTERRLSTYMHFCLAAGGVDEVIIRRLRGFPCKANVPQHYDSSSCRRTESVYDGFVRRTLALIGRDRDWSPPTFNDEALGSSLHIPLETVRELFLRWRKRINDYPYRLNDPVAFHNEYVLMVYAILSICTGYRPVGQMFETIHDFDLVSRQLFICDKQSRHDSNSRQIVLPELACSQITIYLEHLALLASHAWPRYPTARGAAEGAMRGDTPLLFRVEKTAKGASIIRYFDRGNVERWLEDYFDLPLNWTRHFLCTWARQRGFPHEPINAMLGHEDLGPASFNRFSGLSYWDMAHLAEQVNDLLRSLDIVPIRGLR